VFTAIVGRGSLVPLALHNPTLSTVVGTIVGLTGLALFRLGVARFRVLSSHRELLIGLAFGLLGLVALIFDVVLPAANFDDPSLPMRHVTASTLTRAFAAILLLVGARAGAQVPPTSRRAIGTLVVAGAVVPLACGILYVMLSPTVPQLIDPRAFDALMQQTLMQQTLVNQPTPGQSTELIVVGGINALLLMSAAVSYLYLARRRAEPHFETLAIGLTLLAFGWVHALLIPHVGTGYVSTSDLLRLAASFVLLFTLGTQTMAQIAEHASNEERMRLSRELHDGLAQQLSLLHLRLRQAESAPAEPERLRYLQVAMDVNEAAMLEAREAITALRTGVVSWAQFTDAAEQLCDEFAQNHEVVVRAAITRGPNKLGADIQAELLRVLQEALNNAVRHGAAREIDVDVTGERKGIGLKVRDNGHGFDPTTVDASRLGLRLMKERLDKRGGGFHIESRLDSGTTIQVSVPLA
jgi:signal transduction histidine kinase